MEANATEDNDPAKLTKVSQNLMKAQDPHQHAIKQNVNQTLRKTP